MVAWAPHLAHLVVMTPQEGRLLQTHGVLSSIPKGPSSTLTQRKGAGAGPPARWRPLREHTGTHGAHVRGPQVSSKPSDELAGFF